MQRLIALMINQRQYSVKTRKIAHSATEKKRRDSIKHRIHELQMLVPLSAKEENMQQLHILDNAVKYIRQVQKVLGDNGLLTGQSSSSIRSMSINSSESDYSSETLQLSQNVTSLSYLCQ
ncbi:hypothetical protein HDV01_006405 [Terramyces sp. JEL0728]|nr:hypothetical protein HDV01_006405 [Terramyces sp. JEL0728]